MEPPSPVVLVVDDDDEVRRVIAEMLTELGYLVMEAADGVEAWQKILTGGPDIVISDIQMPHCDGLELCRRIKANSATRHILVLIATGAPELALADAADYDGLLEKPIPVSLLLEEVRRAAVGGQPSALRQDG